MCGAADSEELRRRFIKAETTLFRVRFEEEDREARQEFLSSRDFDWSPVSSSRRFDRQPHF
jgi:DNA primase large subunit